MDMATPSERRGLLPWVTGQGSRCSSPSRSVRFMSIFCTGWRNLEQERRRFRTRMETGTATWSVCGMCLPVRQRLLLLLLLARLRTSTLIGCWFSQTQHLL